LVRPFDHLIDDGRGDVVVHLISMEFWISQTFNGVSYGALHFLFASGLSLIFGVMRIVNLAHGSYCLLACHIGVFMMRFKDSYALGVMAGAIGIVLGGSSW
jgi:branched-chain amino acid transport system permease protein